MLFGWLYDRLINWLVGWLVGWLSSWMVGYLFVCLVGWLLPLLLLLIATASAAIFVATAVFAVDSIFAAIFRATTTIFFC